MRKFWVMETSPGYFQPHSYLTIKLFTKCVDFAMIKKQHNSFKSIGKKVDPKEGERRLLCCNKANVRSPSLEYEYLPHSEKLNKAFDILFEEVIKRIKQDKLWNQSS